MSSKPFHISRRDFLKTATTAVAGAALPAWFVQENQSWAASPKPLSPNDKPGIALIGCGGMGRADGRSALRFGQMRAICDVDSKRLDEAGANDFKGATKYKDFRKLLERDDIHAVICGTQDHWHALISIAAMRAGKDVYCEKPLTLTIDEGKRIAEASRKTGRILQTGSQQRSDDRFRLACELVRNGRIGKLQKITVSLPSGPRRGPFYDSPVPAELDWDLWLGPRAVVPYVREKCHGSFRYWYDYSGGTMTDWGAHHLDIAQWANGTERSGPVQIEGKPLIDPIPGGFSAASQYHVEYTYANGVKLICQSDMTSDPSGSPVNRKPGDRGHGVLFEGPDGWIFVTRGNIQASNPELLSQALPSSADRLYVSKDHMGNFFDCIRSRKQPICEAEIGHRSASVCHLGVIAIRLNRPLKWDPEKERFDDKGANYWLAREMRKPWTWDAV